ncbi:MAG: sulfate permease [Alphaproteobacteria bacterium]|nr:sulfate permease [Alphaproteobacteria bacterium]
MLSNKSQEFTPKLVSTLKSGYGKADLRADLIAGLTVAIVALPLAMALAIASGASPDKGLVTAVIAGFLISFLGGSRVQIGGPTGAFVVVVFNVIAQHGYDGLLLATLMAGIMLIIAGYARLGMVIKYVPYPVVTGFTAGIAVIIASSQVKDFLGLKIEKVPAEFIEKWMVYFEHMNTLDTFTLGVGLMALAMIIILRKKAPKLPGYLIAVVVASILVALFHIPVETIGSRFPHIPSGLPYPEFPAFTFEKLKSVLPAAFTIAFLAGIEALLSAVVADGMTGHKHRSNQELVGQGVANVASAFFGGLPATGAIARTATNIRSGAKSPVAGIMHAVFLLIFMMAASDVMKFVPMAALAAILFMVAWGMSEIRHFIHIFKLSRSDRTIMILTFALTVLVDLTVAIGVGVTLACLMFMMQMSKSVEIAAGRTKPDDEDQRHGLPKDVEVFRINGPFFFGVSGELIDVLKRMGQMPKVLIVRMRLVPFLDTSGASALEDLVRKCKAAGTLVIFSSLQPQPKGLLSRLHFGEGVLYADNYVEALNKAREIAEPGLSAVSQEA